jgi:hypothetical protein
MKGCRGNYEQSKTNPDYFVCKVCNVGIWRDYKSPDTSRKNLIESEDTIQYEFGLNTRYTGGKHKNNGGSSSGKSRSRKKVKKSLNRDFLEI